MNGNAGDLEPPSYLEGVHREVDWMQPSDNYILEWLSHAGKQTPHTIGLNIAYSYETASHRCPILANHGLLNRIEGERGVYELSDLGRQYLAGELSPEDLQDDE
ncbi:hypothetical protein [Halococcus hamelinensis]|uniref:Phage PhiH1 repressor protein n=1 Tax=Halococcus hamelinensis 100A6 TaxID=1132509 RepID=M0LZA4_9EURY|nr:hypothetical protein [Halococcus hamelinensis]EMA38488.1 phage PhiH1 repressor protein [Halococcus hamelinensis 100A6]